MLAATRTESLSLTQAGILIDQWAVWSEAFFRRLSHSASRWQADYRPRQEEETPVPVLPDGCDEDMEHVDRAMAWLKQNCVRAYTVLVRIHVHHQAYAFNVHDQALRDFSAAWERVG